MYFRKIVNEFTAVLSNFNIRELPCQYSEVAKQLRWYDTLGRKTVHIGQTSKTIARHITPLDQHFLGLELGCGGYAAKGIRRC
jgi:hypothetical protein